MLMVMQGCQHCSVEKRETPNFMRYAYACYSSIIKIGRIPGVAKPDNEALALGTVHPSVLHFILATYILDVQ